VLRGYDNPGRQGCDDDPNIYLAEGIRHIVCVANGPDWDLGQFREILAWRDSLLPSTEIRSPLGDKAL
jgi:hypothetical protein